MQRYGFFHLSDILWKILRFKRISKNIPKKNLT